MAPEGANITEWAKQERCWRTMRDQRWVVPDGLEATLVVLGQRQAEPGATQFESDSEAVEACAAISADEWFALANWAKQTDNLPPWQRKLAFDIGVRVKRGRPPSARQAEYGQRILDEAQRLGFSTSVSPGT